MDLLLDVYLISVVLLMVLIVIWGMTIPRPPKSNRRPTDEELDEWTRK